MTYLDNRATPRRYVTPTIGTPGPQGPPGSNGTNGAKWHSGATVPAAGTGVVGDWYLRTSNGDVYEKTGASSWTPRGNIRGPQGLQGATGATGAAGSDGIDGHSVWSGSGHPSTWAPSEATEHDTYIDVDSGNVYKVNLATFVFYVIGNIKGATGATGPAGDDGATWHYTDGIPDGSEGEVGDFMLAAIGDVYVKTGSGWTFTDINLAGPPGATVSTVPSQAEAEAGTSTTARVWTAQRVRQAILGYLGIRARGVANVTMSGPGATTTVTFPAGRFSSPPVVHLTKQAAGNAKAIPYAANITTAGCTVGLYTGDGTSGSGTTPVSWEAVQG